MILIILIIIIIFWSDEHQPRERKPAAGKDDGSSEAGIFYKSGLRELSLFLMSHFSIYPLIQLQQKEDYEGAMALYSKFQVTMMIITMMIVPMVMIMSINMILTTIGQYWLLMLTMKYFTSMPMIIF